MAALLTYTGFPPLLNPEMADDTFYWHDYETFGINPAFDRPCQFAGIRTNVDLEPIGDPLVIYCKPSMDSLPSPEACLITGITPQIADQEGLLEPEFISRIVDQMAQSATCSAGYNSLRFDDEVTRYTLYRNFHDPYAREWQNGCSRWDIIDLARMTYALRPEGIEWPLNDDGVPSFRLELLTRANGISHQDAHDALSDVHATIAFAKLIKNAQPKLYDWLYQLRNKHKVAELIDVRDGKPFVHTTRMYPSTIGCTSLVMPLRYESRNKSSVLVYDLRVSPEEFLELDETALNQRLFTKASELAADTNRLPVKSIKINKCPAIAPAGTLSEQAASRIQLDLDQCARHRQLILDHPEFINRIAAAFDNRQFAAIDDVDAALYDGFIADGDRKVCQRVMGSTAAELASQSWVFKDPRLPELLFRYRARNWPETLNEDERAVWAEHCMTRFQDPVRGLEAYFSAIESARAANPDQNEKIKILDALEQWGDSLL